MPLTPEDQQKYKALYLQSTQQIIEELKDNLAKLSSGDQSAGVLEVLHRSFHSLKGQSEMMEFHSLGTLSRLLEYTFAAKREGKLTLTDEIVKKITDALAEIEKSLEEIDKNSKESDLSQITQELRKLTNIQD